MDLKKLTVCGAVLISLSGAVIQTHSVNVFADTTEQSQNTQTNQSTSSQSGNTQSSQSDQTQTKQLSKPFVVYGSGASDKDELSQVLGVNDNYQELTATGADYGKYLGNGENASDTAMISSVSLAPAEPGTGSVVNIKDFNGQNNITQVKAQQYAQVLTMAGVKDVIVTVSANKPVSGTSALTGVYVALAADGIQINPENAEAANSMIAAQNGAINANKDDKTFPGKLTAATTQASADLAQQKQDGGQVTKQDVQDALDKALSKQGIKDQVPSNSYTQIVNALTNVNNAPISMDKNFVKNAGNLTKKLSNSVGDTMAQAKDFLNSEDAKALEEKAKGWLSKVIDWIKNTWNNLFSKGTDQTNQTDVTDQNGEQTN